MREASQSSGAWMVMKRSAGVEGVLISVVAAGTWAGVVASWAKAGPAARKPASAVAARIFFMVVTPCFVSI